MCWFSNIIYLYMYIIFNITMSRNKISQNRVFVSKIGPCSLKSHLRPPFWAWKWTLSLNRSNTLTASNQKMNIYYNHLTAMFYHGMAAYLDAFSILNTKYCLSGMYQSYIIVRGNSIKFESCLTFHIIKHCHLLYIQLYNSIV